MKKKIIIVTLFIICVMFIIGICTYVKKENDKKIAIEISLNNLKIKENRTIEFLDKKKVSDYIENIDGEIIDDYTINSTNLGTQKVEFSFVTKEGYIVDSSYDVNIVDTVAPLAFVNNTYYIKKNSNDKFIQNIFCGDNYDPNPKCYFEGDYDLSKNGTYPVVFKAVDNSGNVYSKKVNFVVYTPSSSGSSSSSSTTKKTKTKFSDVVKKHKTDKTKIGIDISKWQGTVDFDKLKEAGVEFIFIRVGWGHQGKYTLDEQFERNISEANRVGIPVGIYFYSYASTEAESINDALWVVNQIKDYEVELPVAYDWENWSTFNNYNVSFYGLTHNAKVFLDVVGFAGYDGLIYSSKNYLEKIWLETEYDIWLAHYTSKTNYKGDYRIWQLCNNGRVDGIKGDVDINVMYLD